MVTFDGVVDKSKGGKPGYLETYVDPYFGSKVTRVSGDKGQPIPVIGGTWPQDCRNHYQKDPPWNADGSVLFLSKGCQMFLDGNTYQPLDLKTPRGQARFHPAEPNITIVLPRSGDRIERFNLREGKTTTIATFPGYSRLSYMSEGNISGDGRWIAPSGIKDERQVYDSVTGRKVGAEWASYGHPSHYDLGIDQKGDDVAVGVAKSDPNRGMCIMRRLRDGRERALCPAGSHTGTRNTHRPGWAYIQSTHKGLYVEEVIAVKLTWDGEPIVERLAYIPNLKEDYLSETHGAASFDGRKFCAVSNWGIPGGQVQAYVVDVTHLCGPSDGH